MKNNQMSCKDCNKIITYQINRKYCKDCLKEKKDNWKKSADKKQYHKTKHKKYKISLPEYLEITKECSICAVDKSINCHHIIPKKNGGENILKNYVGLCFNCHHFIHKGMSINEIKEYYKKISVPLRRTKPIKEVSNNAL